MRHRKSGRKLGRNSSHRKAMYRNMVTSLMLEGQIRTTEAKAKEVRRIAEKVITLGKRVPLSSLENLEGQALQEARARRVHALRQARKWVVNREALDLVFNDYAERYGERPGGYLRLMKVGYRPGDNAPLNLVALIPADEPLTFKECYKPPVVTEEAAPAEEAAAEAEAPVEEATAAAEEAAPAEEAAAEEAPSEE